MVNDPDPTGTILVKIQTTGKDEDPEGYTLTIEGSAPREVTANQEITIPNQRVGRFTIQLSNIANHCTGVGSMSREVNVVADGTATVEFEVSCKAILRDRIAYSKGENDFTNFKYYTSNIDGTDEKLILDQIVAGTTMEISPDGTRLAFTDREQVGNLFISQIYVMDADGENLEMVPFVPSDNIVETIQLGPVWHPNSDKITFRNGANTVTYDFETKQRTSFALDEGVFVVTDVFDNGNKFLGIYINPGGEILHRLAVCNSDGSGFSIVKEYAGIFASAKMLNEDTIVYLQRLNVAGVFFEFMSIKLDGSNETPIGQSLGFAPADRLNTFTISPDGSEFIFYISNGPNFLFTRTKVNGSPQAINFSSGGVRRNPIWSQATRR